MAKKKNYWYVLVLTDDGPTFVTSVKNYPEKVAYWNKDEKPYEFSREWAQDLAWALCVNGHMSYAVSQRFEIENQPYAYNRGHFEWKEGAEPDENEEN